MKYNIIRWPCSYNVELISRTVLTKNTKKRFDILVLLLVLLTGAMNFTEDSNNSSRMQLLHLPEELLEQIVSLCSGAQRAKMRLACRTMNLACGNSLSAEFKGLLRAVTGLPSPVPNTLSTVALWPVFALHVLKNAVVLLDLVMSAMAVGNCCFFPGAILDAARRVLRRLMPPRNAAVDDSVKQMADDVKALNELCHRALQHFFRLRLHHHHRHTSKRHPIFPFRKFTFSYVEFIATDGDTHPGEVEARIQEKLRRYKRETSAVLKKWRKLIEESEEVEVKGLMEAQTSHLSLHRWALRALQTRARRREAHSLVSEGAGGGESGCGGGGGDGVEGSHGGGGGKEEDEEQSKASSRVILNDSNEDGITAMFAVQKD